MPSGTRVPRGDPLSRFVGYLSVLPPNTVAEVAIPMPSAPRNEGAPPDVAFTYAANRRWIRAANGSLTVSGQRSLEPDSGAWDSVAEHPTMALPHPVRFGTGIASGDTGRLVRPPDPQAW